LAYCGAPPTDLDVAPRSAILSGEGVVPMGYVNWDQKSSKRTRSSGSAQLRLMQ